MDRQDRKRAVAAYKERRSAFGVYAVICEATGQAWVGTSSHLETHKTGLWFGLRLGTSPFKGLQQAWKEHGEAAFRFEELERLRDDYPEIGRRDELRKRQALWRARLDAAAL